MKLKLSWLFLIALLSYTWCFGQNINPFSNDLDDPVIQIPVGAKVIRKLTSHAGLTGLKSFNLEQEVFCDEQGKVRTILNYSYTISIFGKASRVFRKDYTYFPGSHQVQSLVKTTIQEVEGKQYGQLEGFVYDQKGTVTHLLNFHPSGAIDSINVVGNPNAVASSSPSYRPLPQQSSGFTPPDEHVFKEQYWSYMPERMKVGDINTSSGLKPTNLPVRGYIHNKKPLDSEPKNKVVREELLDGYALKEINEEGKILSEHRVKLNNAGQPVQVVVWDGLDEVLITSYAYDAAGNETEVKLADKKGEVLAQYNHTYNDKGLLVKSVKSKKKGKALRAIKYEYEFY